MNGKDTKIIIKTAVSLFLICAIAAGILAVVNQVTSPIIADNNAKAETLAMQTVQPDAESFEAFELSDGKTGNKALDASGKVIGYVFTTEAASYGGTLKVMTGLSTDGVITAVSILSIDDTPGLGMNAKKASFYGQYAGKSVSSQLAVDKDGGEISAITSATITSRAVTKAVNEAGALWKEAKEG